MPDIVSLLANGRRGGRRVYNAIKRVAAGSAVFGPKTQGVTYREPVAAAYKELGQAISESLQGDVLNNWFPRSIDTVHGGFHQNYARDWRALPDQKRTLVYQARLTWLAAQVAQHPTPATPGDLYCNYSQHGFEGLLHLFHDSQYGGLFWQVDMEGRPVFDGEKHSYGIGFALFALAANYAATQNPRALELAQQTFHWLEAQAHDNKNGGYFEALSREGAPLITVPERRPQSQRKGNGSLDMIGTRYGFKSMNTHIHLLEAFTELYRVWPHPDLRKRLQELFELARETITVPEVGVMNLFFTLDWRPVPDHDSYGHDVETAYLLTEAAAALGMPDDARTWQIARRMVDHALDFGWDTSYGGFYAGGGTFTSPTLRDKLLWAQAEGLNALLLMHERYGSETVRYWNAFQFQWAFIDRYLRDKTHTGWWVRVPEKGFPRPESTKSGEWMACYHHGRALLNVSSLLAWLALAEER